MGPLPSFLTPPLILDSAALFVQTFTTIGQLAYAVWLFACKLPLRDHARLRAIGIALLSVIAIAIGTWIGAVAFPQLTADSQETILSQEILFSALLVLSILITRVIWDTSTSTAIFCCTMGYTMQNIASGAENFFFLIMRTVGIMPPSIVSHLMVTLVTTIVVYGLSYLVFVRDIEDEGLSPIADHSMLAMSVVVLLMVIGFDVANKYLELIMTPVHWIVFYRIIHGLTCIFTMLMEYQLLYVSRLQTEVALVNQLMGEQERQWRLSRDTVAAINAKTHTMRHHILRLLAESQAGINRELLREVAHEIKVYDTHVLTGNEILDVILSQKSLLAEHADITFTCVADGTTLADFSPADLNQLVAALLDDALAATSAVTNPERRAIKFDLRQRAGMAIMHLEGYQLPGNRVIPESDAKALVALVQRHEGTVVTNFEGDVYHINIMLPASTR